MNMRRASPVAASLLAAARRSCGAAECPWQTKIILLSYAALRTTSFRSRHPRFYSSASQSLHEEGQGGTMWWCMWCMSSYARMGSDGARSMVQLRRPGSLIVIRSVVSIRSTKDRLSSGCTHATCTFES